MREASDLQALLPLGVRLLLETLRSFPHLKGAQANSPNGTLLSQADFLDLQNTYQEGLGAPGQERSDCSPC